jgi:hypothetical protein
VLKVLLVVGLLALAIYLVVRAVQRGGVSQPRRLPGRPPTRPAAPDDDPDFLRDLDRKRRHPDDPDA